MDNRKTVDIGEVSKRSGLPVSTLRFYEEKGLIHSIGRNGLRRLFAPQVLEQLSMIALARIGGFSLEEIAAMFSAEGQPQIDRDQLLTKAEELDQKIKRLKAVSEGLRHVAYCPEPNQLECSQFQRLVRMAGVTLHKESRKRGRKSNR